MGIVVCHGLKLLLLLLKILPPDMHGNVKLATAD
jgi:hypothetical protein